MVPVKKLDDVKFLYKYLSASTIEYIDSIPEKKLPMMITILMKIK